jgi:PadR family transcriptional regulator PadR
MTHATVQVATALMDDPSGKHWGYDLSKKAALRSGALYPILHRMLDAGWLTDGWQPDPERKRPARRYYELTDEGIARLGGMLAMARQDRRFTAVFVGRFAQ